MILNYAANCQHCSVVNYVLNWEMHLTRSNRKHIQVLLVAALWSISDLGAQLTASWNELYLGDYPQRRY